jgi:Flp pilus assembly protein TadB
MPTSGLAGVAVAVLLPAWWRRRRRNKRRKI